MAQSPETELEQAVIMTAETWPDIGLGDPNTIDLYWQAQSVRQRLGLQLPQRLPPKDAGVALVELVESQFIRSSVVRTLPASIVAERALNLVYAIGDAGLQAGNSEQSYVIALYTWHGCINMAKLLRSTYVVPGGEAAYEYQQRVQGYGWLCDCWTREMAVGNPWVRYGVSLARQLEMNRKQEEFSRMVIEDWVPPESPYWEP